MVIRFQKLVQEIAVCALHVKDLGELAKLFVHLIFLGLGADGLFGLILFLLQILELHH